MFKNEGQEIEEDIYVVKYNPPSLHRRHSRIAPVKVKLAENAFLVRVAAKYEVNQLDKARLASTVPGLTIGCFGPLFGKDDIETLPERKGLEAI